MDNSIGFVNIGELKPWDIPSNYRAACKKTYTIKASILPIGTNIYNKLEDVSYVTDEIKRVALTGTAGEQWVIDVDRLSKTYTFEDGQPIDKDILNQNKFTKFKLLPIPGEQVWYIHIPVDKKFQIETLFGDVLTVNNLEVPHGDGDFILAADDNGKPDMNNRWVVNGLVFNNTYNLIQN